MRYYILVTMIQHYFKRIRDMTQDEMQERIAKLTSKIESLKDAPESKRRSGMFRIYKKSLQRQLSEAMGKSKEKSERVSTTKVKSKIKRQIRF